MKLTDEIREHYRRLSVKLAVKILLFSGFITLIITTYQLYHDYDKDVSSLKKVFAGIQRGHIASLGFAFWNFDDSQVKTILKGIMNLDGVVFLDLKDAKNKTFMTIGEKPQNNFISEVLPLKNTEQSNKLIGNLEVFLTLNGPQNNLFDRIGVVLISQTLKTFIVSSFIILLIRLSVTKYLAIMANKLEKVRGDDIADFENIGLQKPFSGDEIDIVKDSINEFGNALASSNKKLKYMNENLEKIIEDRTKELKEAHEKIEIQSSQRKQLIHVLVHDLKNPIGVGITSLEMAKNFPNKSEKYLEMTDKHLHHAVEIIDLVRNMLSLQEGKKQLDLDDVNLMECVQRSLTILDERIKQKELKPIVKIEDNLCVKAERISFVNSVINNLLTNAIKFSPHGSDLEIIAQANQNNEVQFSIKDHGVGMPPDLIKIVFDSTKVTSRPGTDGEKGTGFGMPLVKEFVEAYGGKIELMSKDIESSPEDHGTEIKITLKKAS